MFGNQPSTTGGLFGGTKPGGIFGAPSATAQPSGGLFGQPQQPVASAFGNAASTTQPGGNLFGQPQQPNTFGAATTGGQLFGANKPASVYSFISFLPTL